MKTVREENNVVVITDATEDLSPSSQTTDILSGFKWNFRATDLTCLYLQLTHAVQRITSGVDHAPPPPEYETHTSGRRKINK